MCGVDDLVLFGSNKRKLHRVRIAISEYVSNLELTVKGNWQVFKVSNRDIDFLGVRFYQDHTTLRRRNALRIRRRVARIRKKGYLNNKDASAILSYWGWIKRTDSYLYYHKYISPYVPLKLARRVVSINAKIRINQERGTSRQREYVAKL